MSHADRVRLMRGGGGMSVCLKKKILKIFSGKVIDKYRLACFGRYALEKRLVGVFSFGNSSFLKNWFPTLRNQQGRKSHRTL